MRNKIHSLAIVFILFSTIFVSCIKDDIDDEDINPQKGIIPVNIAVDIPEAISSFTTNKTYKTVEGDTLSGTDIYQNISLFIAIGEQSAEIVDAVLTVVNALGIHGIISLEFVSEEDNRPKQVVIEQGGTYDGESWEYQLIMTDQDDSALVVYWNQTPKKGVTILSPYNLNRSEDPSIADILYKVEYSETGASGYEKDMTVSIIGIPENPEDDGYINNLKMFAGKNGDIIDVFGNSNHPEIQLIDSNYTGGRNYAFTARGHTNAEVGVAIVGLPPSSVNTTNDLLEIYSVINVLTEEANNAGYTDSAAIAVFLSNAEAPGYFIHPQGFVSNGNNVPSNAAFTNDFINLSGLVPFVPNDVKELMISW